MKRLLLLTFSILLSITAQADSWDTLNERVAGEYSIETKGFFSKSFSLDVTPYRLSSTHDRYAQMGTMTFESKKYGICQGSYSLAVDDETFDMDAEVIESVNGLHCDKLQNEEYKWISVWVVFPKGTTLNEATGPVSGKISIRYEGKETLYKKIYINSLN